MTSHNNSNALQKQMLYTPRRHQTNNPLTQIANEEQMQDCSIQTNCYATEESYSARNKASMLCLTSWEEAPVEWKASKALLFWWWLVFPLTKWLSGGSGGEGERGHMAGCFDVLVSSLKACKLTYKIWMAWKSCVSLSFSVPGHIFILTLLTICRF